MQVNDLWNLLSCHGPNETVVVDATGLKIGRHGHIEVPLAPGLADAVALSAYRDLLASEGLRVDL